MSERELMDLLRGRLYIELQLFKDRLLQQDKDTIYQSAYEIGMVTDIYGMLQADLEEMEEDALREILCQKSGILKDIYEEWLSWEGGSFEGFTEHIREKAGIRKKADAGICREEEADGYGYDKAA